MNEPKYKDLSKFEKFEKFKDINFVRCERPNAVKYLKALWLNDEKVLTEFESFGNRPNQFLQNKREYEQGLLFGFTEKTFDEYGWLESAELEEVEEIKFQVKKSFLMNGISIHKGLNGKYVCGYSCSNNTSGSYGGGSVWDDPINSKEEAIDLGLNRLIRYHTDAPSSISNQIIKMAQEKLSKPPALKSIGQLELF